MTSEIDKYLLRQSFSTVRKYLTFFAVGLVFGVVMALSDYSNLLRLIK